MSDYAYYDVNAKQWVNVPEAEKDDPKYKDITLTEVDETTGKPFSGIGLRRVNNQGKEEVQPVPFKVGRKTFTDINSAIAEKITSGSKDPIEVRVYEPNTINPIERTGFFDRGPRLGEDVREFKSEHPYKPVKEVLERAKKGEGIATLGKVSNTIPSYKNRQEFIDAKVSEKVKNKGFGKADTAKVMAANFVEGISPFAGAIEAIPPVRNLMDINRAYNAVEPPEGQEGYNADPWYLRSAFTTVLPQGLGAVASWGVSSLAGKTGTNVGKGLANVVNSRSAQGFLNPTSGLINEVAKPAVSALAKKVAEKSPRLAKLGGSLSGIPLARQATRAAAPIVKNAVTSAGDTVISDLTADEARGDTLGVDPKSLLYSAGLGGVFGIPGAVAGWKSGSALNTVDQSKNLRTALDENLGKDENTKNLLNEAVDTVEEASAIDLPGEVKTPPRAGFSDLGIHAPSDIGARLDHYQGRIDQKSAEAVPIAERAVPLIQKGLRETIPEYTAAGSAAQKAAFSRVPDRYGIESSYPSAQKATDDLYEDLGTRIYEGPDSDNPRATGKTLPEARDTARGLLESEGLMRSNPDISPAQQAVNTANRGATPSFTATNPSKTVMSGAPNSVVNMPPARDPLVAPNKPVDFSFQDTPTKWETLDTPLTGSRLRDQVLEGEEAGVKPVAGMNRLAQKYAKRVIDTTPPAPQEIPPIPAKDLTGRDAPEASMQADGVAWSGAKQPKSLFDPYIQSSPLGAPVASPAGSYPMANTKGYNIDADIVPYEKIHNIHQRGNIEWGDLQVQRGTTYDKAAIDAARLSTRGILGRAFGDDFNIPQEAKRVAVEVEKRLKSILNMDPDTPADRVALDVKRDAPLIIDAIKATKQMGMVAANKADIHQQSQPYRKLNNAVQEVNLKGLGGLKEGINVKTAATPTDMTPADNLYQFNEQLDGFMTDITKVVEESNQLSTDASFVRLNEIVTKKWPAIEKLLQNVSTNDLNPMGALMREYVIWNSFIGNIPLLGTIGKGMGSLQMLVYGLTSILKQDRVHVKSNTLNDLVVAKNAEKLIQRIEEGVKKYQQDYERAVKLTGLRQMGRVTSSGADKERLPLDSQRMIDALERAEREEIGRKKSEQRPEVNQTTPVVASTAPTATPTTVARGNRVSEAFQQLNNTSEDQQIALYDSFITNGTLTPEEISQLDAMIAGEQ